MLNQPDNYAGPHAHDGNFNTFGLELEFVKKGHKALFKSPKLKIFTFIYR